VLITAPKGKRSSTEAVPSVGTVSHGGPPEAPAVERDGTAPANLLLPGTGILSSELVPVPLRSGDVLARQGDTPTYVYFLDAGLVSLQTATADGRIVEVAMLGAEGIVGAVACLGLDALPYDALVTIPGEARRMRAERLCELLGSRATPLTGTLLKYLQYEVCQVSQSAACGRFHTAGQRLAKWLLLASSRLRARTLPVTHASVAQALGGPRHEISRELSRLEKIGGIVRGRSSIELVDLDVLLQRGCECFDRVQAAYRRLLD
jgi:CRP-like cAMP-binding protein